MKIFKLCFVASDAQLWECCSSSAAGSCVSIFSALPGRRRLVWEPSGLRISCLCSASTRRGPGVTAWTRAQWPELGPTTAPLILLTFFLLADGSAWFWREFCGRTPRRRLLAPPASRAGCGMLVPPLSSLSPEVSVQVNVAASQSTEPSSFLF